MTGTRPPHDLETKAAVLAAPPATSTTPPDPATGITAVDDETGIVTALAAVTGTVDDVRDILVPGCFGRSLRARIAAHGWPLPVLPWPLAERDVDGPPEPIATTEKESRS